MCWFKLDTCPYPHHEPICASIFIPGNASRWKHCDKPQPWGRLSCGKLTVRHNAPHSRNPHTPLAADCGWCTAVLKLEATKSKEIQQQARTDIAEMEEKFNTDAKLKELHTKIGALEMEVTSMRNQAWELRLAGGTNGGSGEWEEIKNEQEIGQGGHAGAD